MVRMKKYIIHIYFDIKKRYKHDKSRKLFVDQFKLGTTKVIHEEGAKDAKGRNLCASKQPM